MSEKRETASGVLVVDKPIGPSSHSVVLDVRRLLSTKVGHTGTLDPLASGVLPLVLGSATRLTQYFQQSDKVYEATVRLGQATETYDGEGRVTRRAAVPILSVAEREQILGLFVGRIRQLPPAYSAVRVEGKRLYELARRNKPVQRPEREVLVHTITLLDARPKVWELRVHCSSGTYIRSLANDIGEELGCGAFLEGLRRIESGQFKIVEALPMEQVEDRWREKLIPLEELLPQFPALSLSEDQAIKVRHGNSIRLAIEQRAELKEGCKCRLLENGLLIALGDIRNEEVQPHLVLRPAQ